MRPFPRALMVAIAAHAFAANVIAQAPAAPGGASAAPPAAERDVQPARVGDAAPRDGGGAFSGSSSSASQAQKDASRGAASRSGSSAISGEGIHQVPRSDTFSGMSGRTGRGGASLGGGGRR